MSHRPVHLLIEDIWESIEKIERFVLGFDREAFRPACMREVLPTPDAPTRSEIRLLSMRASPSAIFASRPLKWS